MCSLLSRFVALSSLCSLRPVFPSLCLRDTWYGTERIQTLRDLQHANRSIARRSDRSRARARACARMRVRMPLYE